MYGEAMGRRLARLGCEVHGFDVAQAARARAARGGVTVTSSLSELVGQCPYVVLSLQNSEQAREVCLGPDGLFNSPPGTVIIDTTSGDPRMTRRIGQDLASHGIEFVDAGVSGTGATAAVDAGTLTILVGGADHAVAKAAPILGILGEEIIHVGGLGTGHMTKTLNNMLTAAAMLTTSEAVTIAIKAGLDPLELCRAISLSQGRNIWVEHRFPSFALQGDFSERSGGPIGGLTKRASQAVDLGREFHVPTPLSSGALQLLRVILAEVGYRAPTTHALRRYWDWSGVDVDEVTQAPIRPGSEAERDDVTPPPRIGLIGLGMYGGSMARRLVSLGFAVIGHDVAEAAAAEARSAGVVTVETPAQVAEHCDHIVLSLNTSEQVSEVCFGDGGLIETAGPGAIIVDTTSGAPALTRQIATRLGESEIHYVDSGVSGVGGTVSVEAGTLTMLVGGSPEAVRLAMPVLRLIGKEIVHLGPAGAGHTAKTLNNMLTATGMLATAEVVAIGIKAGLDPIDLCAAISASQGRNSWTSRRFPEQILKGDFGMSSGGPVTGLTQRVAQAVDLGRELGVPTPMASTALQTMRIIVAEVGPQARTTGFVRRFWDWAGVDLGPDGVPLSPAARADRTALIGPNAAGIEPNPSERSVDQAR
jgi:3-hydroxyisobutyrate dehydrogenase-like beta-hydroxyacid dehydrogenase